MKFIEDLNLKLVYEKEINDVISHNNVDSSKFYELKIFKDQIGPKGHTEWHFDEIVYTLELFDINKNLIKKFQTSYKDKAEKQKKEFQKLASRDNLTLVERNNTVHIGDIYIIGEVCNNNDIEHYCTDLNKLSALKIAYVIDDPSTGSKFYFDKFVDCTANIIMYKHFTTVIG